MNYSNFGKPLHELTDDELVRLINDSSPQYGSLAQYELMRRLSVINHLQTSNLIDEIKSLRRDLQENSLSANRESRAMRHLTYALGVVALLQLLIAYGQYRLGEVQIDASREQGGLQKGALLYEQLRDERLEVRDVQWRREDLEFQKRLPAY
ncbi:MAG TPA: hypothetical protein VJB95_02880 [Candidatus Paceibacterota bacterium]